MEVPQLRLDTNILFAFQVIKSFVHETTQKIVCVLKQKPSKEAIKSTCGGAQLLTNLLILNRQLF